MESIMTELQGDQPEPPAADSQEPGFTPPPVSAYTQPDQVDAVERVVAAASRILYQGDMREEISRQIQRDVPTPQKLAESATGLLLTIDQKSQGGLPEAILAPAGQALLGEAVEVAQAAGLEVSEDDYQEAARMTYYMVGKKLGYTDDQMMQAASRFASDSEGGEQ